jgi:hypothetical protein
MVLEVSHLLTGNLYRNFFRQPACQQLLKFALPIIGLIALYKVGEYYFKTRTVTDASKTNPPAQEPQGAVIALTDEAELTRMKAENLTGPVPANLYCGVNEKLKLQSHRWSNNTNQESLVKLSTGKAYPANIILSSSENGMVYILAESPLNNDIVDWQTDYYRMALEKNAGLLASLTSPFNEGSEELNTKHYHFVSPGKTLKFDDWTVNCEQVIERSQSQNQLFNVYKLTCEHTDGRKKTLYQLLPRETPGGSFPEIQLTIDTLNSFIKDNGLTVNKDHPFLVNCRRGINHSARFVLFHSLQAETEGLIRENLEKNQKMTSEAIYQDIFGDQDISTLLMQLAQIIEYYSTTSAAVDAMKKTVLPRFNGKDGCTPETVNTVFKEHVLETIARLRRLTS